MISLKRNIGITFIGTLVFSLSQWGIISAIAKLGGADKVGIYALAVAIVSPIFAFANLNLRAVQSTDVHQSYSFKQYRKLRICTSLVALLVIVGVALLSGLKAETLNFVAIFALAKFFESISELAYGFQQRHERMALIARSMIARGLLAFASFSLLYYIVDELFVAGLGLMLGWLIVALAYDYPKAAQGAVDESSSTNFGLKALMITTAPLGFVVFCNTVNLNIPRYVIAEHYSEQLLGIYAATSYFIVAGATLINAIGQSATPRLASLFVQSPEAFKVLLHKLLVLAAVIGLSGILVSYLIGDWVLRVFYSDEFLGYGSLLVWVMTAGMAMYCSSILGCGLTSMRCFKLQSVLSLIVVIVILTASYTLIPSHGLTGGAFSILLAYSIKGLLAYYFLQTKTKGGG